MLGVFHHYKSHTTQINNVIIAGCKRLEKPKKYGGLEGGGR